MRVSVVIDAYEVLAEVSDGMLLSEIEHRGLSSSSPVKRFNIERVMDFLKGEGCPQSILSILDEWNHTKVVTLIDLQNWMQSCGIKR